MSEFIMTPTNVDFLESIFRNPITGRWTIPLLTFNTNYISPFYGEIDPLNEDPRYQKSVVDHFYFRLTEKWLYKDSAFRRLAKYFKVERSGNKGTVELVSDPDQVSDEVKSEDRKYVFKYIEKYFITRRFVEKVLRQYVAATHIKWYDLFHNTDILKDLFTHKLKKLIVATIYELADRKDDEDKSDTDQKDNPKKSNRR